MNSKVYICSVCSTPCKLDLGPNYVGAAPDLCVMAQSDGSQWVEEVPKCEK